VSPLEDREALPYLGCKAGSGFLAVLTGESFLESAEDPLFSRATTSSSSVDFPAGCGVKAGVFLWPLRRPLPFLFLCALVDGVLTLMSSPSHISRPLTLEVFSFPHPFFTLSESATSPAMGSLPGSTFRRAPRPSPEVSAQQVVVLAGYPHILSSMY
jgi:hypothetical protein